MCLALAHLHAAGFEGGVLYMLSCCPRVWLSLTLAHAQSRTPTLPPLQWRPEDHSLLHHTPQLLLCPRLTLPLTYTGAISPSHFALQLDPSENMHFMQSAPASTFVDKGFSDNFFKVTMNNNGSSRHSVLIFDEGSQ